MLQTLRDNLKGTIAIFIVVLMVIPFALFGVDSLFLRDASAGKAAEVNGQVISEMDLARAVQLQKQQIIQRFGEQAPAELLVDEQLRGPVLNRLIQRELIKQAASDGGMAVSDAAVDQMIVSNPQFQQDGQFNQGLFVQLLRNLGYTPTSYRDLLIEDVLVNQHATAVAESGFATVADLERLTRLTQQRRSFFYLTIPFEAVKADIAIEDEEIRQYYDNNEAAFMTPEMVSVDYIEVNLDQLAEQVEVSDDQVRQQYEAQIADFEPVVQRHVAHILVEESDDAESQLSEVQRRLAAGEEFADLARDFSDDLGSSELGGDLGFTDGSAFPEAFEAAVAELEVGQVSEIVETDSGYHLIKLLDESRTEAPVFEEVKDSIRDNLAFAEAEQHFVELIEMLPDATYNAADLQMAADELGLEAITTEHFDRENVPGVLSNNQVRAAIFSDEVLEQGHSSDVIEISSNQVVVVKLRDRKPESLKSFDQVKETIIETLTDAKASQLLAEKAEALTAQLKSGQSMQEVAEAAGYPWQAKAGIMRNDSSLNPQLVQHVFSLPKPAGNGVVSTVELDNGHFLVTQLTVVEPGKMPELKAEQLEAFEKRLASEFGNVDFTVYQAALKQRADITIYE